MCRYSYGARLNSDTPEVMRRKSKVDVDHEDEIKEKREER